MLISMPTGTSTIFGVFQLIPSSHEVWREHRTELEPRTTPEAAQVRKCGDPPGIAVDISLLGKAFSLQGKVERLVRKSAAVAVTLVAGNASFVVAGSQQVSAMCCTVAFANYGAA